MDFEADSARRHVMDGRLPQNRSVMRVRGSRCVGLGKRGEDVREGMVGESA